MPIRDQIIQIVRGHDLTEDQAAEAMEDIMTGVATPAQVAALLTALHLKGETDAEIAGMARVMRTKAIPVHFNGPLLDTCGTGGDGVGTFNISTTAAFIAAGAGATVAKHGNRAMSSVCGSADVLEGWGSPSTSTPPAWRAASNRPASALCLRRSSTPLCVSSDRCGAKSAFAPSSMCSDR